MSGQAGASGEGSAPSEVTPEMVEAGVHELLERRFGDDPAEVVTYIYLAMDLARSGEDRKGAGLGD